MVSLQKQNYYNELTHLIFLLIETKEIFNEEDATQKT